MSIDLNRNKVVARSFSACAVFTLIGFVIYSLFPDLRFQHYPLHATLESVGSIAAFIVAILILSLLRYKLLNPAYIFIASGLFGMGMLDGLHALMHAGKDFVWLHSIATFFGGSLFACVWIAHLFERRWFYFLPAIAIALSCMIGAVGFAFPELIPAMIVDGEFTYWARLSNIAGGIGFLIAAAYFINSKHETNQQGRIIFSTHCLLFGISGIIFEFSIIWDAMWWYWHLLRAGAYMIALYFYLNLSHVFFYELYLLRQELIDEKNKADLANQSKSVFLANMSHEIRTPMNGVLGVAELLSNTHLNMEQSRMVQTIQNSSKSLLRIIDDILDVSKIEAGKLTIEKNIDTLA